MSDTIARLADHTTGNDLLVSSGPCKYPYARIGEGKVHRTTTVSIRWRHPDDSIPPVSVHFECCLGQPADNPRLRLLREDDLPSDARDLCRNCFGVRATIVFPPAREGNGGAAA